MQKKIVPRNKFVIIPAKSFIGNKFDIKTITHKISKNIIPIKILFM
jgi:hypothetical protein